MPALLPRYSLEDLARFPDDRNRYELVAGHLLVTPEPAPPHELVVTPPIGGPWPHIPVPPLFEQITDLS
jgi:hypothetical protein